MKAVKESAAVEQRVTLAQITPGPFQARRVFDQAKLAELASSIKGSGVIVPPLVFADGDYFRLVAGERRWRASCAVVLAGKEVMAWDDAIALVSRQDAPLLLEEYRGTLGQVEITVRVSSESLERLHQLAIIDNQQRADLLPTEEARDFLELKTRYGYTNTRIGRITGKSTLFVKSRLRLLDLDEPIRDMVDRGDLSKDTRVTEALLSIEDKEIRLQLARRFVAKNSTIKAIVESCKRTLVLLEQTRQQKPKPRITVSQVAVTRRPVQSDVNAPVELCPACARAINLLAEELCSECSVRGLTQKCMTCPGVIEILSRLIAAAEVADVDD